MVEAADPVRALLRTQREVAGMLWRSAESNLVLDEWTRELRADDRVLNLPPKCFELLLFLAQRSERVVSRKELFDAVWPGVQVTESSLNQVVSLLRRALGPHADGVLRTVRGQGYRLTSFHRVARRSDVGAILRRSEDGADDIQELCTEAIDCLERATRALRLMLARPGAHGDASASPGR